MKGLRLFKRVRRSKGATIMLISWHHPKSITWRWQLQFSKDEFHIKPHSWQGRGPTGAGHYKYLWFSFIWQKNMFVKNQLL